MKLQPLQRAEIAARHAAASAAEAKDEGPRRYNLGPAFQLGGSIFVRFRGRHYGVPPVPWREGQQLLAIVLAIRGMPKQLTPELLPRYQQLLAQIPALLWQLSHPSSRWQRLGQQIGLLGNPFEHASESELVELADFFLVRRMKSNVGFSPAMTSDPQPLTSLTT